MGKSQEGTPLVSHMRISKRILIAAAEVGVLIVGFVLSIAIAAWVDSVYNDLTGLAFFSCLGLSFFGFLMVLRKTRRWKIDYDAEGWRIDRYQRQVNPTYFQRKRTIHRILMCLPSGFAAFVLLFFPVSSHLLHLRSRYLAHYEIPIPLAYTVFGYWIPKIEAGSVTALVASNGIVRFGLTPFWGTQSRFSLMNFESIRPNADTFEFNHNEEELVRSGAVQVSSKSFNLGGIPLVCWQYVPRVRRWFLIREWIGDFSSTESLWEIRCDTPTDTRRRNLYAYFYGREADISTFYSIISQIKLLG